MDLQRRIVDRDGELLLFAVTPPRSSTDPEAARRIAEVTAERLRPLGLDGLIVYDIDEESDRNAGPRPFPFLPTMDPATYREDQLRDWPTPVVVYRATAKYDEEELRGWLRRQAPDRVLSVFVGASSRDRDVSLTLGRAWEVRRETSPDLLLGGVAIPERHSADREEHLRLLAKQEAGCSFFVTQVVYNVDAAKTLVSDYVHECAARGLRPVPVVLTFSVCGSMKTLAFLRWLGVDVPGWIENDLRYAQDTLETSLDHARSAALDLIAFGRRIGLPLGINVESVSIRKVEIDASVRLAREVGAHLAR